MLVVPTYVEKSEVNGLGLFAGRDIEEGEVIWLFDPNTDLVFDENEYSGIKGFLSKENRDKFDSWSYRRGSCYILCADNSNFWNHSETNPNCGGESPNYTVALRNIKAGEELLENYKDYDNNLQDTEGELYDEGRETVGEEVGETQS